MYWKITKEIYILAHTSETDMNERIREIHMQVQRESLNMRWNIGDSNRFAELIVRECIDIASQEDFDVMMKEGYPCSQTAKKIKEHFGVDE